MTCNFTNMAGFCSRICVLVRILFIILPVRHAEVTNFGLCKDPDCTGLVALGETTANYNPPDEDKIFFKSGQLVKIYSIDAGHKNDLLGVNINGNRGYVPKHMVRITKALYKAADVELVPAKHKIIQLPKIPKEVIPKSVENVKHGTSAPEPSPFHSTSAENFPSTTSQSISSVGEGNQYKESVVNAECNVYSESKVDADLATHSGSELRTKSSHAVSSQLVKTSIMDIDAAEHQQTVEVIPTTQPYKNGFQVSGHKDDAMRIASGQYSHEQLEKFKHPASFVVSDGSSAVDVVPEIDATSTQNVDSYRTESIEHEHHSLTEAGANMDSSVPGDTSYESISPSQTNNVQLENTDVELSNTVTKITESLPHAVESVVESFSADSAKNYQESIRQATHLPFQEKESVSVKDQIDSTIALLEERGLNVWDLAADSNSDSASESAYENSVDSKNAKFHNNFYAQSSLHVDIPRKVPLVHNFNVLKKSESLLITEKQKTKSEKGSFKMPQSEDYYKDKNVNMGRDELTGDDASGHKILPKDTGSLNIESVMNAVEAISSNAQNQNLHVLDRHATAQTAHVKSSTVQNTRDKNYASGNVSDSKSPLDDQHKNSGAPPFADEALGKGTEHPSPPIPYASISEETEKSGAAGLGVVHPALPIPSFADMHSDTDKSEEGGKSNNLATEVEHPAPHTPSYADILEEREKSDNLGSGVEHPAPPTPSYVGIHHDAGISDKKEKEKSQTGFTDSKQFRLESVTLSKPNPDTASAPSESSAEASFTSRHLKSEVESNLEEDVQHEKQDGVSSDSSSFSLSWVFSASNNTVEALRSLTEAVILWFPEPFQLYLDDLQSKGVPPRAVVFTGVIAIPTVLLFITVIYIRQSSKEKRLLVKLSTAEQKLFAATAERDVLKEDGGKLKNQLSTVQGDLEQEQKALFLLKEQLKKSENLNQSSNTELRAQIRDLENQVEMKTASISALQTALEQCKESNNLLQRKLQEEENAVSSISIQLQEFEEEARTLQKEKEDFIKNETSYKEKNVDLEQSCNQLLQEAEVWNSRVNELTQQLQSERSCRDELESNVQAKDSEIQSLLNMVSNFEVIQEFKNSDSDEKIIEEKMKQMIDTSAVEIKLKKVQEEKDALIKSFESERDKVMELEVELLEARSETEKLKSNYNQALQDKTEAQTKLEVLSNYFKDKEMQLQKELGVQEAVRQQKEEDASFAARRINLIEEENASYKYQVATLKQEIEETEQNYKNQVALQEKKAHDNWLAARAAERKLEDVKQEAAQLRQRLTLLEREQENWLNSSRDEIVRPVPKRPAGSNGEIGVQDINRSKNSSSGSLPLPPMIPPLHPPILPLDRPLPPVRMPMIEPRGFPLPPPPVDPYFDFGPPLHFPPQRWHLRGPHPDPLHPLDRRTPANYERGHLTPPPHRHQSPTIISDRGDIERRSASPKEVSSRGSHTSSPPHPLPLFHDMPPPPPRAYDFGQPPPPPHNPRYPLPPPPRREFLNQGAGLTRTDSRNSDMITSTPRGAHQLPAAQDRRQQQPSSRV